jgi:hypothetical protein
MRAAWLRARRIGRGSPRERGQGLVEFALVVPVFMMLLLIMVEFGYAFNHNLTLQTATREGARTGAALASGGVSNCAGGNDPGKVDAQIVGAMQKILKSPGSDIVMSNVSQIRIFKASATGAQIGTYVDVWTYSAGAGPDLDPGTGTDILDFVQSSTGWAACSRLNGPVPDSLGVAVRYNYQLQTPLQSFMLFMHGNEPNPIVMNDQTVMVLNPTN